MALTTRVAVGHADELPLKHALHTDLISFTKTCSKTCPYLSFIYSLNMYKVLNLTHIHIFTTLEEVVFFFFFYKSYLAYGGT